MNFSYSVTADSSYPLLLTDTKALYVEETKFPYRCWTERHVQILWHEQKYFNNLVTADGQEIKVFSPGIWNFEAGPDFLKAHIKIGDQEFHGDVEIHMNDEDWIQHRHQSDVRYNNVILHVSLFVPKQEKSIQTLSEKILSKVHLEKFLTVSQNRILQLIDLDLYPYRKFIGSGRCAKTLFNTLPKEKIRLFFKQAANWRLLQKSSFLNAQAPDYSLQIIAGIAMALGYKQNTQAFLELFNHLIKLKSYSETELFVAAIGVCGFFSNFYKKKWENSFYYQTLFRTYQNLPSTNTSITLVLHHIRPFNHPIRRLVYLTRLLSNPLNSLYSTMIDQWDSNWGEMSISKKYGKMREQLKKIIPTYQDPYWNYHYTFEEHPQKKVLSLIGDDLKEEILINTFFPLLYEKLLTRQDLAEIETFHHFYESFSALKSSKTRYLTHRFFGDSAKGSILNSACQEQGAYQLHRDFYLQFEASCEGCQFVDRFKSLNGLLQNSQQGH